MSECANDQNEPVVFDFAAIRQRVSLKEFVKSLGVELTADGKGWRAACPLHNEKHGTSFRIDDHEVHWICFGKCQDTDHFGGDVIDLARAVWECDTFTACTDLLNGAPIPTRNGQAVNESERVRERKWPERDLEAIDRVVGSGPGLYDLAENSPLRFDDEANHAEEIIDIILPGDPWLCIGQ